MSCCMVPRNVRVLFLNTLPFLFFFCLRLKPKKKVVELETTLKPFVPDFIPAVGDIDGYLKITRPGTRTFCVVRARARA